MWRKLLKVILYGYLIFGTIICISLMFDGSDTSFGMGFIGILVVWLSGSGMGLILEMATGIANISKNSEEIKQLIRNTPTYSGSSQMSNTKIIENEEMKNDISVRNPGVWVCICGNENPEKNKFCMACGMRRDETMNG